MSFTLLVKGAAIEASASERLMPASACFRAPQSFAPSPHIPIYVFIVSCNNSTSTALSSVTSWHKPMPYEVCAAVSPDTFPNLLPESPVIYHSEPLQTLVWAAFPKVGSPPGRFLSSISTCSFHDLPNRSLRWRLFPMRAPRPVFLLEIHPKSKQV